MGLNGQSLMPKYRQIKDYITDNIKTGHFVNGQKLPTERELALQLNVSRGTVKKAYGELEKDGFVNIVWGSGVFVGARKKEITEKVDEYNWVSILVDSLLKNGYTDTEIEKLIGIQVMNKIHTKKVNIAAVDCNIEALQIFQSQLSHISDLNCTIFLLSDVQKFNRPAMVFDYFDLIFTTTTHVSDLIHIIPGLEDKIIKAAVSPDKNTVVNLFKISAYKNTGLLVKSRRFKEIIVNSIRPYGFAIGEDDCIYEKDLTFKEFDRFIENKEALIMPPLYTMNLKADIYDSILNFISFGGKVITFNYSIEKGSLIYIEEKILNILDKPKE